LNIRKSKTKNNYRFLFGFSSGLTFLPVQLSFVLGFGFGNRFEFNDVGRWPVENFVFDVGF